MDSTHETLPLTPRRCLERYRFLRHTINKTPWGPGRPHTDEAEVFQSFINDDGHAPQLWWLPGMELHFRLSHCLHWISQKSRYIEDWQKCFKCWKLTDVPNQLPIESSHTCFSLDSKLPRIPSEQIDILQSKILENISEYFSGIKNPGWNFPGSHQRK